MSQFGYFCIVCSTFDCKGRKESLGVGNLLSLRALKLISLDRYPSSSDSCAASLEQNFLQNFSKGCKKTHNLNLCICGFLVGYG